MTADLATATVRTARPQDAEALSRIGRETFIETFVEGFGIPYPAEDLEQFLTETFGLEATVNGLADPGLGWWVAEHEGQVVAFAMTGPNTLPHPDTRPGQPELKRLYVSRAAQGLGLGQALFTVAIDWMQARTDGPLWIGVWSGNAKAQRFYAHHGFEKVGDYQYPVGRWLDDEFILRRG